MCRNNGLLDRSRHPARATVKHGARGTHFFPGLRIYMSMSHQDAAKRLFAQRESKKRQGGLFAKAWKAWKSAISRNKWR